MTQIHYFDTFYYQKSQSFGFLQSWSFFRLLLLLFSLCSSEASINWFRKKLKFLQNHQKNYKTPLVRFRTIYFSFGFLFLAVEGHLGQVFFFLVYFSKLLNNRKKCCNNSRQNIVCKYVCLPPYLPWAHFLCLPPPCGPKI